MLFTANYVTHNLVQPLWNEKCLEVVDGFFSPDADIRTTFLSGIGPMTLKKSVENTFKAFPTFELIVEEVIQYENKLTYKWQANAKHEGTILGIPGSGQQFTFSGIVFGEIEDNQISVYHSFSNIPQVLQKMYSTQCTLIATNIDPIDAFQMSADLEQSARLIADQEKMPRFPLTKREIECLSFWIRGFSIKESAKQMGNLSERTVQTYRENIKQKFQAKNFQQLLCMVQEIGGMSALLVRR